MESFTKGTVSTFPYQKRSRSQKNKKFFIECLDAADTIIGSDLNYGIRASMQEKISNYNLINDIIDPKEVTKVVNPYNIEADFDANYRNYPLINSYMNVLLGEERKRRYSPIVVLTTPDLINQKQQELSEFFNQHLVQQILSNSFNEQDAERKIKEHAKWAKFHYRDRREKMATEIIQYGFHTLDFKTMFSRNFEDLLAAAEEIAVADIIGGEPILRKGNPLNFYTIRSGESPYIEDSDLILELSYIPVGQAIDEYHDELTSSDIKKLEEGYSYTTAATSKLFNRQLINKDISFESWISQQGGLGKIITAGAHDTSYFGGGFDEYGNVRKLRVVWKGMRKVGILTYFDENNDMQKKYIDEDYPLEDASEDMVKWIWISEWMESTRLADDINVKMGPRPVQFRSIDNPSKCLPGIVGTAININSSTANSLVGLAKPYQLTYNYFMHKLWDELKTYKGKIARISTSMIPSEFTMDQFLFYLDQMKIIFEDPFKEGKKGAALGKLAGHMNQSSGHTEIGDPNVIQNLLGILSFLENRIQDITGVTPQRKGAIESRETVGGIERSVTQSTLSTEKYFAVHENFKNRAVTAYLETAKVAWKGQSFKRQFVLSDGSQAVLDFDSEIFKEAEYGVYTTNAVEDQEMFNTLKQMVQPFIQNGGSLSMVMELYRTQDPAALQRKYEAFEEQIRAEQRAEREAVMQAQREQIEAENQKESARLELEKYKIDLDRLTALEVEAMKQQNQGEDNSIDEEDKLELERQKLKLQEKQLDETIRKNKKTEEQKEKEIQIKRTQANKKPVSSK